MKKWKLFLADGKTSAGSVDHITPHIMKCFKLKGSSGIHTVTFDIQSIDVERMKVVIVPVKAEVTWVKDVVMDKYGLKNIYATKEVDVDETVSRIHKWKN